MTLFQGFLFAHVLGAIIAFGPTFTFPIIGRLGAQERAHANFATRLSSTLSRIQVVPFAILQGITGLGLIVTAGIDVMRVPWLMIAIVLYLIALGYALFVQAPTVKRVIAMTSGGPPAGAPTGVATGPTGVATGPTSGTTAPSGGTTAPSGGTTAPMPAGASTPTGPGPGGPPPELLGLIRRVQLGGLFLMALVVSIVFLMVVKPGV